jgi:hypothetical protein
MTVEEATDKVIALMYHADWLVRVQSDLAEAGHVLVIAGRMLEDAASEPPR